MKITGSGPLYTGPLMSWDVFMQGYRRNQQLADDKVTLEAMAREQQWQHHFDFESQLYQLRKTVIVTTPGIEIVFASSSVTDMTGYYPEELIGKSPRVLQGTGTSETTKSYIRQAIRQMEAFETALVNYRKNGAPYKCIIKAYPVFNKLKRLVNFIAFEHAELTGQ